MAQFCTCGSIIINGLCTNKNCVYRTHAKSSATKSESCKNSQQGSTSKSTRRRRASKCIVYNLYDKKEDSAN